MKNIILLGDSITHAGLYPYLLQQYSLLYCGGEFNFINSGVAGGRAKTARWRLAEDVYDLKPDMVVINFGMNDVEREHYDGNPTPEKEAKKAAALLEYQNEVTGLIYDLQGHDINEIVLCTPPPFDEYNDSKLPNLPGCNEEGLSNCAKIIREIAARFELPVIDLHSAMTQTVKHQSISEDRVHPLNFGHYLIAAIVLKALQLPAADYGKSFSINNDFAKAQALADVKTELNPFGDKAADTALEEKIKRLQQAELLLRNQAFVKEMMAWDKVTLFGDDRDFAAIDAKVESTKPYPYYDYIFSVCKEYKQYCTKRAELAAKAKQIRDELMK